MSPPKKCWLVSAGSLAYDEVAWFPWDEVAWFHKDEVSWFFRRLWGSLPRMYWTEVAWFWSSSILNIFLQFLKKKLRINPKILWNGTILLCPIDPPPSPTSVIGPRSKAFCFLKVKVNMTLGEIWATLTGIPKKLIYLRAAESIKGAQ